MGRNYGSFALAVAGLMPFLGCTRGDPAERFIRYMDGVSPDKRVPNWEQTRAMMMRSAPAVGDAAPDFTLKALDGNDTFTLSNNRGRRPTVLILASYT